MNWHEGDVSEAVNKVNLPNKHLIVFLRDESSLSSQYSNIFEKSEEMHSTLANCVCLNLSSGTKEFQQFSDVYKATDVPSIYVISYLGKVLEVVKGEITDEKLFDTLKEIVQTDSEGNNESQDDSQIQNDSSNSVGSGETEARNVEDKVMELRQKLAEKHRQKLEEEKEKEIADELNRRELGKKLVELKKFQKEQEEKEVKDEIKRQKDSDKEARLKVLRQIEEDKQERKNRFTKQEAASPIVTKDVVEECTVRQRPDGQYTSTRLQFRFPDGSAKNSTFDCTAQFSVVRQFVANHVREHMNNQRFEIKQFFPKKTIGGQDDVKNLAQLELVPSASLAVIFLDRSSSSALQVGTGYVDLLLAPVHQLFLAILALVQWTRQRLFGPWTGGAGGGGGNAGTGRPSVSARPASTEGQTGTNATSWEDRQRRLIAAETRTIKKDGNLAQFSDTTKTKDDKDDATWNGNSTQQM